LAVLFSGFFGAGQIRFLNFINQRFDTGCFGLRPDDVLKKNKILETQNKIMGFCVSATPEKINAYYFCQSVQF
jgi:hypothetical protein